MNSDLQRLRDSSRETRIPLYNAHDVTIANVADKWFQVSCGHPGQLE